VGCMGGVVWDSQEQGISQYSIEIKKMQARPKLQLSLLHKLRRENHGTFRDLG